MSKKFVQLLATFFYIGYLPGAPGTMASVAGVVLYLLLRGHLGLYLGVTALIIYLGFRVSGPMETLSGKKDPGCIVIDEVAGMLLSLFLLPASAPVLWSAFFLFRAFDMFKIYPVNKFEAIPGGTGVMMDDLVAGVYTCVVMHIALWLIAIF